MRKERGSYIVELFDELGSKIYIEGAEHLNKAREISDNHCEMNEDYSAVILRVIVNTKQNNEKWSYKE